MREQWRNDPSSFSIGPSVFRKLLSNSIACSISRSADPFILLLILTATLTSQKRYRRTHVQFTLGLLVTSRLGFALLRRCLLRGHLSKSKLRVQKYSEAFLHTKKTLPLPIVNQLLGCKNASEYFCTRNFDKERIRVEVF